MVSLFKFINAKQTIAIKCYTNKDDILAYKLENLLYGKVVKFNTVCGIFFAKVWLTFWQINTENELDLSIQAVCPSGFT